MRGKHNFAEALYCGEQLRKSGSCRPLAYVPISNWRVGCRSFARALFATSIAGASRVTKPSRSAIKRRPQGTCSIVVSHACSVSSPCISTGCRNKGSRQTSVHARACSLKSGKPARLQSAEGIDGSCPAVGVLPVLSVNLVTSLDTPSDSSSALLLRPLSDRRIRFAQLVRSCILGSCVHHYPGIKERPSAPLHPVSCNMIHRLSL